MECWSDGVLMRAADSSIPVIQYSNIPVLHRSITSLLATADPIPSLRPRQERKEGRGRAVYRLPRESGCIPAAALRPAEGTLRHRPVASN